MSASASASEPELATAREAVANLRTCYASVLSLCSELRDHEWTVQSLCPDWSVHGVVSHLAGIEHVMVGWRPEGDKPAPFDQIPRFVGGGAKSWSGVELTEALRADTARREVELAALTDDDLGAVSWTPIGVQTYGRFLVIRVFDFWAHEQDMRVPLGRPGHLEGGAPRMALDEVRRNFGYIVGKKVAVPDGASVRVTLNGPVPATLCATVDGRARVVDHLDRVDAEITTDHLTFLLLGCGRIDPYEQLRAGTVVLNGDRDLAERLATNLRFTF